MTTKSRKNFNFQKKVTDTLFDHDVMKFIDSAFDDEMNLDKGKTKKFLQGTKKAIDELIAEAEQL